MRSLTRSLRGGTTRGDTSRAGTTRGGTPRTDTRHTDTRRAAGARSGAALAAFAVATLVAAGAGGPAAAAPAEGELRHAGGVTAVPESYLVVLRDRMVPRAEVDTTARRLADAERGRLGHVFRTALRGFEVSLGAAAARRLAAHPTVAYVQQNHRVRLLDTQVNPPSWGLDRVDQVSRPLDARYTYPRTASNVRVYVVDTGIRTTHTDFGGRAVNGFDAIDGGPADDCNGHGTHVAGTTGGATYGVAKGVSLVAVRVLDCQGNGTTASVVAGVDWVTADHDPGEAAVANMSLGGGANSAIDTAVRNSIADGVSYAVAAGNSAVNACEQSPSRVTEAVIVGATDINDNRASFSNTGGCLDLFAPGVDIPSAWWSSDTATNTISGTSMAAPHTAGNAALVLAANPALTPAQVEQHLVNTASTGRVGNPGSGSPNRLLFVDSGALRLTSFGCEPLRAKFNCQVAYSGGIAPIAIQWTLNGSVVSAWNNLTRVSIGCVPGNAVAVTVRISDAAGAAHSASRQDTCRSGNP